MSDLQKLVSHEICKIVSTHNYHQVVFEGATLNVHLPMVMVKRDCNVPLTAARGHIVVAVAETKTSIDLVLDNFMIIKIDARPECYLGPEGLEFYDFDGTMMIWRGDD